MGPRRRLAAALLAVGLVECSRPLPVPMPALPAVRTEAEGPPEPSTTPASTAAPSSKPVAPEPAAPRRVIVICNDCGGRPISILHFQYGSTAVSAREAHTLQEVAEAMKAHPEITRVEVEGHADLDEGKRITGDLSRRRAEAVRDQLVARGIESGRLVVVAHGSTRPLDNNATVAGRAHNRRVQFRVDENKDP